MTIELTKRPLAKPVHTDPSTGEDVYVEHKTYGSIEYRVPAGTPVTREDGRRHHSNGRSKDPRQTFPGVEVVDDALVIPIVDVVDEIIARADPVNLARALWSQSEEVRDEFIRCLSFRFSEGGIGDAERRKFLDRVKEAITSKAVDDAVSKLTSMEHDERQRWSYWTEVDRINQVLRDLNVSVGSWDGGEPKLLQFDTSKQPRVLDPEWSKARATWAAEVIAKLVTPMCWREDDAVAVPIHEIASLCELATPTRVHCSIAPHVRWLIVLPSICGDVETTWFETEAEARAYMGVDAMLEARDA